MWEWAARGAASYGEMTNVPGSAPRGARRSTCRSRRSRSQTEALARDGTLKVLFHTADGHPVEAVLMRYRDGRRSVCLSSQSGCPLTCTFCATGPMRFGRNLTACEILDQALHFRRIEPIDHVVFMGMGEPMLNLDPVLAAARRLPDLGVTHRRTTISTVGWLPGLTRFVDEVEEPIRLALSLHAPADALRSRLMPVNDRFPLEDVLAECRRYVALRGRRVFVEYVLLDGVNDSRRARRGAGAAARPEALQGQPDPVQPDRDVRRARRGRAIAALQGGARPGTPAGDGAADPRPRHPGRLRPACSRRTRPGLTGPRLVGAPGRLDFGARDVIVATEWATVVLPRVMLRNGRGEVGLPVGAPGDHFAGGRGRGRGRARSSSPARRPRNCRSSPRRARPTSTTPTRS